MAPWMIATLLLPALTSTPRVPQEAPRLAVASPAVVGEQTRYRIRSGDTLEIKVIGRAELTQTVTVAPDGRLVFPYVGEILVEGQSIPDVIGQIRNGLQKQLQNPQVLVSVLKRRMGEVSILGPVKEPGKRELGDDWRVLNLVAAAGGLTVARAEFVNMTLIRKGGSVTIPIDPVQLLNGGDLQINRPLEDGDLLVVQERDPAETMVHVVGEVGKPGFVPIPRDATPLSVLAAAGGATAKAALSKVQIQRGNNGPTVTVDLGGGSSGMTRLGPGDTLYIPANTNQIYVQGAVGRPGSFDMPERFAVNVYWALQQAGGTLANADLKNAVLIRMGTDGIPVRHPINLEKLLQEANNPRRSPKEAVRIAREAAEANLELKPWDTIQVPARRKAGGAPVKFKLTDVLSAVSLYSLLR